MKKIIESKYFKYCLLILGLVALYLHFGAYRIPIMIFIWPFCFLYLFRKSSSVIRFILLSLVIFIQAEIFAVGAMGDPLADVVVGIHNFLVLYIIFVLDMIFYKKINKVSKTLPVLFFPILFAAVYSLENQTFALFNAGQYTIPAFQGLVQCSSIIGFIGVAFIIALFASIMMHFVDNYGTKNFYKPLIVYLICFVIIVSAGELRVSTEKNLGDDTVRVAMATTSQECDFTFDGDCAPTEQDINYVYNCMEEAASCNATFICFAEECVYLKDLDVQDFISDVAKKAKSLNLYVFMPMEVEDADNDVDGLGMNQFYFINNKGEIDGMYEKSELIPIMEEPDYVAGDGNVFYKEVELENGKKLGVSAVICFDVDHELYVSTMNDNTDILFVPSWTWPFVDPAHTNVMRLRAIENRVCIVNPSACAKSGAVDWQGNTIAISDQNVTGINHVTIADVPYNDNNYKSIYHYISFMLYYLNCIAFVFIVVFAVIKKIRNKNKK